MSEPQRMQPPAGKPLGYVKEAKMVDGGILITIKFRSKRAMRPFIKWGKYRLSIHMSPRMLRFWREDDDE